MAFSRSEASIPPSAAMRFIFVSLVGDAVGTRGFIFFFMPILCRRWALPASMVLPATLRLISGFGEKGRKWHHHHQKEEEEEEFMLSNLPRSQEKNM